MADDFTAADTVDPLNLTFTPDIAMNDDDDAQPDWSQFTNILMDEGNAFKFPPLNDMSSIPSDFFAGMDFNPAINADTGDLNYNFPGGPTDTSNIFGTNDYSALGTPAFPFTFQQPDFSTPHPRRLSITSSSSSSGASNSLSPIMQPMSATPVDSASPASSSYSTDPAEELAQRVIQSAGIMLAVPSTQLQPQGQLSPEAVIHRQLSLDSISHEQLRAAAAAITAAAAARSAAESSMPTHISIPPSSPSTIKSSPSPTPSIYDAPVASSSSSPAPSTLAPAAPTARPRTSHTTIERRYRTNLNTRIQSLRLVVPALRVLDKKKVFPEDTVDSRGFIDGVKVARKCSKANVLGKAEEYIRVLKRREKRLIAEQNGMKALLSGLVGGAGLLREWEREWRKKYGAEEKDEIEGLAMEESDDEEGEGDEDDSGGDGEGRKRKKPKIAAATTAAQAKKDTRPMVVVDGQVVPEKRKRGRPRKVVVDPAAAVQQQPPPVIKAAEPTQQQPRQYLFAVLAVFSFFNSSPSTLFSSAPSPDHGTHTGHVLSSQAATPHGTTPSTWSTFIQSFHLLVSVLVFASIVTPWILPSLTKSSSGGSLLRRVLNSFNPTQSQTHSEPTPTPAPRQHARRSRAALLAALAPSQRGSPDEVDALRSALDADPVIFIWRWFGLLKEAGFEARGIEQRAWVRLGEVMCMRASTSFLTRLQTYYCMSTHVPQFGACVSDLVTLSLVLYPLWPSRARTIWARAQGRARTVVEVRPCERLAVESLTLDEAARRLSSGVGEGGERSPVHVLARSLVIERLEREGKRAFVGLVLGAENSSDEEEEEEVKVTVEAAKSLGGYVAELGDMLEALYKDCDRPHAPASTMSSVASGTGDVRALLTAVLLYKRIFPASSSSSSSAGPAIVLEDKKAQLELRRVLDESVFDFVEASGGEKERGDGEVMGALLEDARDRVVDRLIELGRVGRS